MLSTKTVVSAQTLFGADKETELIEKARTGEVKAFNQLYQLHVKRIYALCWRMLGDKESAQDVTQDIFVQVWKKLDEFRGDSKFSTWLHRVATNIVLGYLRKQKNWLQRVFSIENDGVNVNEPVSSENCTESWSTLTELDRLICKLPERARIVFVLHAVEGYRHDEIAAMTNMATGTSKSQYSRARSLLMEWLDNER